jgi:hypothetical protein
MKRILIILAFLWILVSPGFSQLFVTRDGVASFYSSAPLEDIEAVNRRVQVVLDGATGEINIRMRIEDFQFEKALMQRHFNERFMESHLYPEARFSGYIEDFEKFQGQGIYEGVIATGSLMIHGVTREVKITGTLERAWDNYNLNTVFPVAVADYDIRIPRILFRNIADVVDVTAEFQLVPQN